MNITTHCYPVTRHPEPIFSFFPNTFAVQGITLFYKIGESCNVLVDLDQLSTVFEEQDSSLPLFLLSVEEQSFFSRFKYPKRRKEWLGGRLAAKTAMLLFSHQPHTLADELPGLSILPNKHGRPIASTFPDLSISISHSSRFAAAMAVKDASCGIDLQKISPKLPDLTSRFTSEQEKKKLTGLRPTLELTTALTMIWTAKEAVKKSMLHDQPTIFSGIALQEVTKITKNNYLFSCKALGCKDLQKVAIHTCPPYVLALTGGSHA